MSYVYWVNNISEAEHAARAAIGLASYLRVLRIPTDQPEGMSDPNRYSSSIWLRFTPLQELQNAMHLLDCVPTDTPIPDVGCRYDDVYLRAQRFYLLLNRRLTCLVQ